MTARHGVTVGLFRSDDARATWSKVSDERALRQRAWYYTRVYADPQQKDTVHVLNVEFHKSTPGCSLDFLSAGPLHLLLAHRVLARRSKACLQRGRPWRNA